MPSLLHCSAILVDFERLQSAYQMICLQADLKAVLWLFLLVAACMLLCASSRIRNQDLRLSLVCLHGRVDDVQALMKRWRPKSDHVHSLRNLILQSYHCSICHLCFCLG